MSQQLNFQTEEYFDYVSRRTTHDGKVLEECRHRLKIVADLTASCICPICGAPDCGKDMYLWAEFGDEKLAVYLGESSFNSFLDCWYYDGIKEEEYQQLPEFIRQNNEGTGWSDFDSGLCKEIDAFDFLKSLEVVKNSACGKDGDKFSEIYYPVLKSFVNAVIAKNAVLNILN
jgi:hypothetical protein